MSDSSNNENQVVPRAFFEKIGFELPEDVISFYIENNEIIFNVQVVDEVGCNFRVYIQEEKFALSSEQANEITKAGYTNTDGYMIL